MYTLHNSIIGHERLVFDFETLYQTIRLEIVNVTASTELQTIHELIGIKFNTRITRSFWRRTYLEFFWISHIVCLAWTQCDWRAVLCIVTNVSKHKNRIICYSWKVTS